MELDSHSLRDTYSVGYLKEQYQYKYAIASSVGRTHQDHRQRLEVDQLTAVQSWMVRQLPVSFRVHRGARRAECGVTRVVRSLITLRCSMVNVQRLAEVHSSMTLYMSEMYSSTWTMSYTVRVDEGRDVFAVVVTGLDRMCGIDDSVCEAGAVSWGGRRAGCAWKVQSESATLVDWRVGGDTRVCDDVYERIIVRKEEISCDTQCRDGIGIGVSALTGVEFRYARYDISVYEMEKKEMSVSYGGYTGEAHGRERESEVDMLTVVGCTEYREGLWMGVRDYSGGERHEDDIDWSSLLGSTTRARRQGSDKLVSGLWRQYMGEHYVMRRGSLDVVVRGRGEFDTLQIGGRVCRWSWTVGSHCRRDFEDVDYGSSCSYVLVRDFPLTHLEDSVYLVSIVWTVEVVGQWIV
ncbi:hypothetical protein Tco_1272138 [Tanacetum coccineum]